VYNLECKIYEDIGVLDYCKKNEIIFVCYQPLRRNRTAQRNYPVLVALAEKYQKTQNQILLNRIIKEKNIFPLVKTTDIAKIKENVASLDFVLNPTDYETLNEFRSPEFDTIEIDWNNNGQGITIDQLANQFD
jgi:diketogulonate reductase-like aldo/keto reductase